MEAAADYQRIILSASHESYAFEEDNQAVYHIYKDVMVDADGWMWFNRVPVGNGHAANLVLTLHYHVNVETA
jgi:hypothetical protein